MAAMPRRQVAKVALAEERRQRLAPGCRHAFAAGSTRRWLVRTEVARRNPVGYWSRRSNESDPEWPVSDVGECPRVVPKRSSTILLCHQSARAVCAVGVVCAVLRRGRDTKREVF
jgi:hypothetical protein